MNFIFVVVLALLCIHSSSSFSINHATTSVAFKTGLSNQKSTKTNSFITKNLSTATKPFTSLRASDSDDDMNDGLLTGDKSVFIGAIGILANLAFYYSLYQYRDGCYRTAITYADSLPIFFVIVSISSSLVTKITTGSGLPAGKLGLVGAAEGLSFLSIIGLFFTLIINDISDVPFLQDFFQTGQCIKSI